MRICRYIGHRRNSAVLTKRTVSPTILKAQRKRCDSGAIQALPSSIPLLSLFYPSSIPLLSLFYPFSNTVQTLRSTHNRKRPQNKKKAPAIAYIF